jgi:TatA/E family protein of Tat protein translocase
MTPTLLTLAFIDGLGGGEMMLIFFVILLLFGGQRLPELARGLGRSVREFKKATAGVENEIKRVLDEPAAEIKSAPKVAPAQTPPPPALIEPLAANEPPAVKTETDGTPPTTPEKPVT